MILIDEFLGPRTWPIREAALRYLGGDYEGEGELHWEPSTGFRVELHRVTRDHAFEPPLESGVERGIEVTDFTSIRMKLGDEAWAVVPRLLLANRLGRSLSDRLSISTDRVIFRKRSLSRLAPGGLVALGLCVMPSPDLLPEFMNTVVTVGEKVVEDDVKRGALTRGSQGDQVLARMLGARMMRMMIEATAEGMPRSQLVRWPRALAEAISILSGSSVSPIALERWRGNTQTVDVQLPRPTVELRVLSPFDEYPLKKDHVLRLADFLALPTLESWVCSRLIATLFAAAEQKTVAGFELGSSTALEAALRTLYGWPFAGEKRRTGVVLTGLRRFCNEHGLLNHSEGIEAHAHLRDRNAHPDWIRRETTSIDQETYLYLRYLVRFYGFMIAALARIDELINPFRLLPGAAGLSVIGTRVGKRAVE